MKKITCLFALLFSMLSFGQNVNDYKYVVVPNKFDFSKETNPFGLSASMKAMLLKYKFEAYLATDAMPDEVLQYNCNKLYAHILENNTITTTKLTIVLKDCKGNVVYKSAEGKSRTKDWKIGYNEAFRDAAKSFNLLHYKYNGATPGMLNKDVAKANETAPDPIQPVAKAQTQGELLFAQHIPNGFQLVDHTPKVVAKIFKTQSASVYIAEKESFKGVLRQENGQWLLEYYANGKLVSEALQIKF